MAIAFVQKITGTGSGVNSSTYTLGGSSVAGNFLALMSSVWVSGGSTPNATPSGLGSWNTTTAPTEANDANCFICYNEDCTAGTAVTVDYGTGYYTEGSLSEYSGLLTSSSLDVQTSNFATASSDATPDTGTTGATAQNDELVLVCLQVSAADDNVEIDSPAATGYTSLYLNQDSFVTIAHSSDYKIVAATGTQIGSWGTIDIAPPSGTTGWSAKIATFKGAGPAGTQNQIAWMTA